MTTEDLDEWGADFLAFCARFVGAPHPYTPNIVHQK